MAGPDALDRLVQELQPDWDRSTLDAEQFLAADAYRPLPTLVQAARELFSKGDIPRIHRARAATDPAVDEICRIVREAAATKTRRLVLLTGVPGAGKTLVGLRVVHAHFLDDLAVARADGSKPTAPAVFLSGNGPLVEVLQYELAKGGGGGKAFVRGVKDYVERYSRGRDRVPPEHVLVFDEAQRAWDKEQMQEKHGAAHARSEPEHFIEFAERIPEWCVVVGLIGTGQEIHIGEEGGLVQWRRAIEGASFPGSWIVHGPEGALGTFGGAPLKTQVSGALNLDTEIRFHLATDIHDYVERLLASGDNSSECAQVSERLESAGYHLRIARDRDAARSYLRERYAEHPAARFGMVASSRDRDLVAFGIPNDFQSTKRMRLGPWYSEGESSAVSCRHLEEAITEFGAQGLELDAALLAWGTDLMRADGRWSHSRARGYQQRSRVRDAFKLRVNAYRVLLTRGRDGTVVFVPPLPELDETFEYLASSGFSRL